MSISSLKKMRNSAYEELDRIRSEKLNDVKSKNTKMLNKVLLEVLNFEINQNTQLFICRCCGGKAELDETYIYEGYNPALKSWTTFIRPYSLSQEICEHCWKLFCKSPLAVISNKEKNLAENFITWTSRTFIPQLLKKKFPIRCQGINLSNFAMTVNCSNWAANELNGYFLCDRHDSIQNIPRGTISQTSKYSTLLTNLKFLMDNDSSFRDLLKEFTQEEFR